MIDPNNQRAFDAWMARLNKKLRTIALGFDTNDFSDQPYYDWWEDGYSTEQVIKELAAEEGFEKLL